MVSVLNEDGTARDSGPTLPAEKSLYLYRTMVLVREFDRRMLVLQRQGRIGFYGPILGQEAATVGSVAAVADQDWIFPALREGAAAMMRGLPMHLAVAQLIGNDLDLCKGRQMPCHYTWKKGRYISMSSVVGTQITHAVGAAMAAKLRGDGDVILGYLGDGATSTNDFHAGMNLAGVWNAPVVLFCQNNQWAISVPVSQQHAGETIAAKGKAYGVRSVRVDGNDVLAVYQVTREAADLARKGQGPTFIEAVTYRRLGAHSTSDDPSSLQGRDGGHRRVGASRDPGGSRPRPTSPPEFGLRGRRQGRRGAPPEVAHSPWMNQAVREAGVALTARRPRRRLIEDVYRRVPAGGAAATSGGSGARISSAEPTPPDSPSPRDTCSVLADAAGAAHRVPLWNCHARSSCKHDAVVIGAGPGRLRVRHKTAPSWVVDTAVAGRGRVPRRYVCLNVGCIPSPRP